MRVTIDPSHLKDVPKRLQAIAPRLHGLTVEGAPLEAHRVVAIVGTRDPGIGVTEGTFWMASELAKRGVVIVSGGAIGIDTAAHAGALSVGGRTWAVLPHEFGAPFLPKENANLFRRIAGTDGCALVYPFTDGKPVAQRNYGYHHRNKVLVALADAVIAVQAPAKSGTLSSCDQARAQGKPLYVVPPVPWMECFDPKMWIETSGSLDELCASGAIALYSLRPLLADLGLVVPEPPIDPSAPRRMQRPKQRRLFDLTHAPVVFPPQVRKRISLPARSDPDEQAILDELVTGPKHPDELVHLLGLSSQAVSRALLTLSLDTVVVDGPDGRYRMCG